MGLNAKQRLFVANYIKTKNATKAAKAAGYSAKTAHSMGSRLLTKVEVRKALGLALERVIEKAELKAADVLAELRKLAFVNVASAFNPNGSAKALDQLPDDVQASLAGLEVIEVFSGKANHRVKIGEIKKFKTFDKVRALELLAKHFKLLTDVHEHTGKDGGPQVILMMPANGSEAPPEKKEDKE